MARDGHVRVLPLHVANKIAAGEVVERPASVVKELIENAIDAGAQSVKITITQGGRKLIAVQDDGCGMTHDDAVLSLERQATSKILDVDDIERIDTLGFRGEAIPSIASVSRFTLQTRRHEAEEGTLLQVNAGTLAEVRATGCPPGTRVEVRDLFCNVPARRKFLRAYTTEENHVRNVFIVHALAHPSIGFSLTVDGHERHRLAPASTLRERVFDLFGSEFLEALLPVHLAAKETGDISVSGFIERPNLSTPTRREQFVFVNARPATAPSITYALREAYPRRPGDVRPATILFLNLPPTQVDVNVHPTKREVRFRDNVAIRQAILKAVQTAILGGHDESAPAPQLTPQPTPQPVPETPLPQTVVSQTALPQTALPQVAPKPVPQPVEFAVEPDSTKSRPWQWFKLLAQSDSGYLLVETDAGIVTINPIAARARITYERLIDSIQDESTGVVRAALAQSLLIPETVRLSPTDYARLESSIGVLTAMGFQLEPFGPNTFKVDAVPQLLGNISPTAILATIAHDLLEGGARRGARWREELIAKSIARSYAGANVKMSVEGATQLIEELCACRMPYVCPRGKLVMIFTSTRELNRKFDRA